MSTVQPTAQINCIRTPEQSLATHCVASLSDVYNHHERNLSERRAHRQHHAHGLVVCAMHVHLNHDDCLDALFLGGSTRSVRGLADKVSAESGVRDSVVNLVPLVQHQHTHFHPMT